MDKPIPPYDPNQSPPTAWEIFKTIQPSEYLGIFKIPCAQRSIYQGIAFGSFIGASRYIISRKRTSALNWGVFSFAVSCILSWEYCRYQRNIIQVQLQEMAKSQSQTESQA